MYVVHRAIYIIWGHIQGKYGIPLPLLEASDNQKPQNNLIPHHGSADGVTGATPWSCASSLLLRPAPTASSKVVLAALAATYPWKGT